MVWAPSARASTVKSSVTLVHCPRSSLYWHVKPWVSEDSHPTCTSEDPRTAPGSGDDIRRSGAVRSTITVVERVAQLPALAEATLPGHLTIENGAAERQASLSYVPADPEADTQLQFALRLLRGEEQNAAFPAHAGDVAPAPAPATTPAPAPAPAMAPAAAAGPPIPVMPRADPMAGRAYTPPPPTLPRVRTVLA